MNVKISRLANFLPVSILTVVLSYGEHPTVHVKSLEALQASAGLTGKRIVLAPGRYDLKRREGTPVLLDLWGNDCEYDLTGARLRVDSQSLRGTGMGHENVVRLILLRGTNLTLRGLDLETEIVSGNEGFADMYANSVEVTGQKIRLVHGRIVTRGSAPYGFGDAFGKGGRPPNANKPGGPPFIPTHKHCGIRVCKGGGPVLFENLEVVMHTYGHGIYFQEGAHDLTLRDVTVTGGETIPSEIVRSHPLYVEQGRATYGEVIPPGIRISRSEDGIRAYGPSAAWGAVRDISLERVVVRRMRHSFALGDLAGTCDLKDCESWEAETGFMPAAKDAVLDKCRGDVVNGPLLYFQRGATNVRVQIEVAGSNSMNGTWPLAVLNGVSNEVRFTSSVAAPSPGFILVSKAWREWRHRPALDVDADPNIRLTRSLRLVNHTPFAVALGSRAAENTVESSTPVYDMGRSNRIQAPPGAGGPVHASDIWGPYVLHKPGREP